MRNQKDGLTNAKDITYAEIMRIGRTVEMHHNRHAKLVKDQITFFKAVNLVLCVLEVHDKLGTVGTMLEWMTLALFKYDQHQ